MLNDLVRLASEFKRWATNNNSHHQSDTERLLSWLDSAENPGYQDFLSLAQEAATLGFKTAVDVPISEEDFTNRKVVHYFESWLKESNQPLKRSSDYLLAWLEQGNGSRFITSYQHFLQLVQTLVNKGYKAPIDLPISETDFNQTFNLEGQSIFFDVIKKILTDNVTALKNDILGADLKASQKLYSVFKNNSLSKIKRNLLDELLPIIHHMSDKGNDEDNCKQLQRVIAECKRNAKMASESANNIEGLFGQRMVEILSLIKDIYDKLNEMKLLDIRHNSNSLNQFRYHIAYYLSINVAETRNNTSISFLNGITQQKEEIISHALKNCALVNKSIYPEYRDQIVVEHIHQLIQNIKLLRRSHSSLTTSFFAFSVPNVDSLQIALLAAINEINLDKDEHRFRCI